MTTKSPCASAPLLVAPPAPKPICPNIHLATPESVGNVIQLLLYMLCCAFMKSLRGIMVPLATASFYESTCQSAYEPHALQPTIYHPQMGSLGEGDALTTTLPNANGRPTLLVSRTRTKPGPVFNTSTDPSPTVSPALLAFSSADRHAAVFAA